jgi:hypothetical protein
MDCQTGLFYPKQTCTARQLILLPTLLPTDVAKSSAGVSYEPYFAVGEIDASGGWRLLNTWFLLKRAWCL